MLIEEHVPYKNHQGVQKWTNHPKSEKCES